VTQSVCAECGEASPSGAQFCPACGHFLWTATTVPDNGPAEDWWTEARPAEPRPVEPPPVELPPGEPLRTHDTVRVTADRAEEAADPGAGVRLIQETSAAPAEVPVRLRLEPSALRTDDTPVTELHVVVDNRAGPRDLRVRLAGRDPEERIRFTFGASELWVPPHTERAAPVQLHAPMPPPGGQADRTFTITVHNGPHEIESAGHWVQRTGTAPITTAAVRLDPEEVRLRDREDAYLSRLVDNRRGDRPLRLRLSGHDPGAVLQFAFRPPVLDVGPGRTGRADIRVIAPLAPHGEETVRTLRVRASDENGDLEATGALRQYTSPAADDGRGSVEASGTPVQSGGDRRTVWRVALTVLGAVLVAVGCFRDWLVDDPDVLLPGVTTLPASIGRAVAAGPPSGVREAADLLTTLQPVERTLTLLLAAVMAFGLTGPRGGLTRTSGMVVALTMVAGALFWRLAGLSLADGVLLVAVGGAVGVVGSLFVRR
jgi:hypothetical protein